MLQISNYIKPLLLLLLAGAIASCNNKDGENTHARHQEGQHAVYTCPMHPEIIRNAPASCPICGMDLVKKEEDAETVQDVELDALLKPANEFVVSTIPITTFEQREEDIELDVLGTVTYDTRQVGTISSRVSGRIERLYLRYKYQKVQKGQKVMDIYSPELVTAQQNLLFLLKNDAGNTSLINAAEDRLLLLGMSRQQVRQVISSRKPFYSVAVYSNYSGFVTDLNTNATNAAGVMNETPPPSQELVIKEGMYLQKGQAAFSIYNAGKVWILLSLFPEQHSVIKVGNPVRIVSEIAPQQSFSAKIDYIEPVFRPGSKTITARIFFNNTTFQLPIGSRVRAVVSGNTRAADWLPKEAVLSLGREKIVFVKEPGGFRAKRIVPGLEVNNSIQIINGLSATDSVAANAQFLVDNEAFIKVK